jgi:hypothetical protein
MFSKTLLLLLGIIALSTSTWSGNAQAQATEDLSCHRIGNAQVFIPNHTFCYVKGRRMKRGSVYAECRNGKITCYPDSGLTDSARELPTHCIEPPVGVCGRTDKQTPEV